MSKKSKRRQIEIEEKASSLSEPSFDTLALFGASAMTAAGEQVGPESAMRVPAVAAAVRTIAETVASLPIHVFKRLPDGGRERDRDHPAHAVLEQPAPWMDGYTFRLRIVMDAIKHGRGVAVVARGGGKVQELHRIAPGMIRVDLDDVSGEPSYVLTPREGSERRYRWGDVVDIVPVPTDGAPVSLIALGREAIGFASILQKHGARLFANGAKPSALVGFKGKISAVEIRNRTAVWNATHGGDRSGGTAFLDHEPQYQQLTLSSVDAQFLELWRFAILEIARVFRLPPHMVGELDRATHANSEEMGLQFVSYTLRPWLKMLQDALTRVLLKEEERKTHFLEFQLDDLTRGNIVTRFAALRSAVGGPWLSPDEARAIENRPAIDGGDKLNAPQGVGNAAPADPGGDGAVTEPNGNLRIVK